MIFLTIKLHETANGLDITTDSRDLKKTPAEIQFAASIQEMLNRWMTHIRANAEPQEAAAGIAKTIINENQNAE